MRPPATYKFERVGPIGNRVGEDRRFGVTAGALLHVGRLGRSAAVEASPIAPFRIQLDPVWRISDHEPRLAIPQQPSDSFRAGGVAAEHPVRTQ
jgi:hypothetical protein